MLKWLIYLGIAALVVYAFIFTSPFPYKDANETQIEGIIGGIVNVSGNQNIVSQTTYISTPTRTPKPTPTPTPRITISPLPEFTANPQVTVTVLPPPTIRANPAISKKDQSTTYHKYYYSKYGYITFETYSGLSNEYADMPETYYTDFTKEVILPRINDDRQDQYLSVLVDSIRDETSDRKEQAMVAIELVQHIPYDKYKADTAITTMDWSYPYTTLHTERGVCADKSILLVYMLKKLGYDTVLFNFDQHMAVGIKCSPLYDFEDSGYAYIETTGTTIPTYVPTQFVGGYLIPDEFEVVYVTSGGSSIDFSEEFRDAKRLKELEGMGTVLPMKEYQEYTKIVEEYDLQYA